MNQQAKLWDLFSSAKIYDLAHPLHASMPVSPNHPGFKMALMRRHGDMVRADGSSASNEVIMMGGHTGTHIDALCHVSYKGELHGGHSADEAQRGGLFRIFGTETIPILFCRGVLLDVASTLSFDVLPPGFAVTADHLSKAAEAAKVRIEKGNAVLIRTGWTQYWNDPSRFLGLTDGAPGPDESAAAWLAERGARVVGAETIAFECIPPGRGHALLPVHRTLIVENGIHIIEGMNLSQLTADKRYEFLFVVTPLKVVGATGVPVRPVAVV
ncbi:cyclase family protein [soil metagenome]